MIICGIYMKLSKLLRSRLASIKNPEIHEILSSIDGLRYGRETYGIFDPARTVFLGDDIPVSVVLEEMSRRRIQHFVQLQANAVFLPNLTVAGGMLLAAGRFLLDPVHYFFPSIYNTENESTRVRRTDIRFRASSERDWLLRQVREFTISQRITKPVEETAKTIVDEMFSNVMQAPIDQNGNRIFENAKDQKSEMSLGLNAFARLTLAHDEDRLLISMEDPCGSLVPEGLWSSLAEAFDPGLARVGIPSDAKLGMKLMIESCSEFAIVSKKNIMTSVNCSLKLGVSGRCI
jgi:hypothetical protein